MKKYRQEKGNPQARLVVIGNGNTALNDLSDC